MSPFHTQVVGHPGYVQCIPRRKKKEEPMIRVSVPEPTTAPSKYTVVLPPLVCVTTIKCQLSSATTPELATVVYWAFTVSFLSSIDGGGFQ
jgi:hypothetical protein